MTDAKPIEWITLRIGNISISCYRVELDRALDSMGLSWRQAERDRDAAIAAKEAAEARVDYWKNVAERENAVDARPIVELAAKAQRDRDVGKLRARGSESAAQYLIESVPLVTLETLPGMAGDQVAPGVPASAGVAGRGYWCGLYPHLGCDLDSSDVAYVAAEIASWYRCPKL